MLNKISTKMIRNPIDSNADLTDVILTKDTLSLSEFGYKRLTSNRGEGRAEALVKGMDFIKARKFGTLEIPAQYPYSDYVSYVDFQVDDLDGRFRTRHWFYRYPINHEERVIGGDFQIGDIVYNTDISRNPMTAWICTEEGSPGSWKSIEFLRNHYSELERIDYLPDPNKSHLGRQIHLTSDEMMYTCKLVEGDYKWVVESFDVDKRVTNEVLTINNTTGKLSNLSTTTKSNLVSSINEVSDKSKSNSSNSGKLADLSTTDKSNLVAAINEVLETTTIAITNKVDKVEGKGLSANDFTDEDKLEVDKITNKVDKVEGKGLSANDFTDDEQTKLTEIEAGAQVNTVNSVGGFTGEVTKLQLGISDTITEVTSGVVELDPSLGNIFKLDLTTDDTSITLLNPTEDGITTLYLYITKGVDSYPVTFLGNILWDNWNEWQIGSSNSVSLIKLTTLDKGVTWLGSLENVYSEIPAEDP